MGMRRKGREKFFKGTIYVTLSDAETAASLLNSDIELEKIEPRKEGEIVVQKMTKLEHMNECVKENKQQNKEKLKKNIVLNSVLKISNFSENPELRVEKTVMRKSLSLFNPCLFVDQQKDESGMPMLLCRFTGPDSATRFLSLLEKSKSSEVEEDMARVDKLKELLSIENFDSVQMTSLEGDEEIEYWKAVRERMIGKFESKRPNRKQKFQEKIAHKSKRAKKVAA